jgi:hypothetical protein
MNYSGEELQRLRDHFVSGRYQEAVDFMNNKYLYELKLLSIKEDKEFKFSAACSALFAACLYTVFNGDDVFLLFDNMFISNLLNAFFSVAKNIIIAFGILFILSQIYPLWVILFATIEEANDKYANSKLSTKVIMATIVAIVFTVPAVMVL